MQKKCGMHPINNGKLYRSKSRGLDEIINEAKAQLLMHGNRKRSEKPKNNRLIHQQNYFQSKNKSNFGRNNIKFYGYTEFNNIFSIMCSAYGMSNIEFLRKIEGKSPKEIFGELDKHANLDEQTTERYLTTIDECTTENINNSSILEKHNFYKNNKMFSLFNKKLVLSDERASELVARQVEVFDIVYKSSVGLLKQRVEKSNLDNPEYLEMLKQDMDNILKLSSKSTEYSSITEEINEIKDSVTKRTNIPMDDINGELSDKISRDIEEKDKIETTFDNYQVVDSVNDLRRNNKSKLLMLIMGEKQPLMLPNAEKPPKITFNNKFANELESNTFKTDQIIDNEKSREANNCLSKEVQTQKIEIKGEIR